MRNCKLEFDIKSFNFPHPHPSSMAFWLLIGTEKFLTLQRCPNCLCQLLWHVSRWSKRTRPIDSQTGTTMSVDHSQLTYTLTLMGVFVLARVFVHWLPFLIGNKLIPFNELKNIVYLCVSCKLIKLRMRFGPLSSFAPRCCILIYIHRKTIIVIQENTQLPWKLDNIHWCADWGTRVFALWRIYFQSI